jgi:hypothetical protein
VFLVAKRMTLPSEFYNREDYTAVGRRNCRGGFSWRRSWSQTGGTQLGSEAFFVFGPGLQMFGITINVDYINNLSPGFFLFLHITLFVPILTLENTYKQNKGQYTQYTQYYEYLF